MQGRVVERRRIECSASRAQAQLSVGANYRWLFRVGRRAGGLGAAETDVVRAGGFKRISVEGRRRSRCNVADVVVASR